ncbi:MAG: zinc ribbon domain-containing protein [Bacillota bacterium]|nr:zinc ribbon domain-containing protein [Bacillota bacterium]
MSIINGLEKVKNSIQEVSEEFVNKSQDMIQISKINLEIASYENEVKEIYESIGIRVFENYKQNTPVNKEFGNECERIRQIKKNIKGKRKEILKIKRKKICKNCGNEIGKDVKFCNFCGSKQ